MAEVWTRLAAEEEPVTQQQQQQQQARPTPKKD
jgi:hypothetical protein